MTGKQIPDALGASLAGMTIRKTMNKIKNKNKHTNILLSAIILFVWSMTPIFGTNSTLDNEIKEVRAASPTVYSRDSGSADSNTIVVGLSGNSQEGDLYMIFLQSASLNSTWSQNPNTSGWTSLYDSNGQSAWYKQIDEGEPAPQFTQSENTQLGYSIIQIRGHEDPSAQPPEASILISDENSAPDPPVIIPTGGEKEYLFIAFAGVAGANTNLTSAPDNYNNMNTFGIGDETQGVSGATAERIMVSDNENPGTFTLDSSQTWFTSTIAVHPRSPAPFTQNTYRWFVDNDQPDPTNPWSRHTGIDLAENTEITIMPAKNDPPDQTQPLRLRVNFTVSELDLTQLSKSFKLQYRAGTDASCTTGEWTDVAEDMDWEYADSQIPDGSTITTLLSTSDVAGHYVKSNPSVLNTNSAEIGQDIEYDFHIIGTNAKTNTRYLFRVITADGAVFTDYNNCPALVTRPGAENFMRHGNVFTEGSERGFFWTEKEDNE